MQSWIHTAHIHTFIANVVSEQVLRIWQLQSATPQPDSM